MALSNPAKLTMGIGLIAAVAVALSLRVAEPPPSRDEPVIMALQPPPEPAEPQATAEEPEPVPQAPDETREPSSDLRTPAGSSAAGEGAATDDDAANGGPVPDVSSEAAPEAESELPAGDELTPSGWLTERNGPDLAEDPSVPAGPAPTPETPGSVPAPADADIGATSQTPAPAGDDGADAQADTDAAVEPAADDASDSEPAALSEEPSQARTSTATDPPAVPPAATSEADQPAAQALEAPSFDLVRVGADGRAVMVGRGPARATIDILLNGEVIAETRADGRGEWVALPDLVLPEGNATVGARAERDGDVAESQDVIALSISAPAPIEPGAGDPPDDLAEGETVAVLMPRDGVGLGRLLQSPRGLTSPSGLQFNRIAYDEQGALILSGRGLPDGRVRLLVDGERFGEQALDALGDWRFALGERISPGEHDIVIEHYDSDGQLLDELDTPISRAAPRDFLASESEAPAGDLIVVQPGNNLWQIARRLYGAGERYLYLYDANSTRIDNPNAIYPGQILTVPRA